MLRHKTFQNKIAVSRFSLPVTATLIAMIWVAVGLVQGDIWTELAFALASTLLMVELNNRNALMRTYSRMVSCSFLTLLSVTSLPEPSLHANVVTLCFIAFTLLIWNGYQDRQSTGRTFYAFACLGIASMEFVQILYYLPILWAMKMFFTNSFSLRNFASSILGVIIPYWFAAGFFVYTNNIDYLPEPSLHANVVTLCFIAFTLLIWNGYQDRQSTGRTFYAFACLGIASMEFVQILYYLPILWAMKMFFTNSFSLRNFASSILGVIIPYWFAAGFFVYTNNIDYLIAHFASFIDFHTLFDYSMITVHQLVNLSFITLLAVIGAVHFLRTSYADKIRTRMIYESFIMLDIVSFLFLVLQPQHEYELEGIMIVCTAPLFAHFITFTKGKLCNITFITILVMAVLLLLYNLLFSPVMLL